jgi:hypothetical protein
MYQMASPVKPSPYQALPQTQQMAQQPQQMAQQSYTYDPAQASVNTASPAAMMAYAPQQQQQQLAQSQPAPAQASMQAGGSSMGDTANVGIQTPAEIGAAAASKVTAPPSWKDPDMSLKTQGSAKGKISAAAANKCVLPPQPGALNLPSPRIPCARNLPPRPCTLYPAP